MPRSSCSTAVLSSSTAAGTQDAGTRVAAIKQLTTNQTVLFLISIPFRLFYILGLESSAVIGVCQYKKGTFLVPSYLIFW